MVSQIPRIQDGSCRTQWLIAAVCLLVFTVRSETNNISNRLIDYDRFLAQATEVGKLRSQHRVTEQDFLRMAADPATVVLDARSREKFLQLHVKGGLNLSFSDMTEDELAKVLPSKSSRVLIYCNNNFLNAPEAFATKAPSASLNVHTFNALYSYGYTNVFELGPLIDIRSTQLPLEGTRSGR